MNELRYKNVFDILSFILNDIYTLNLESQAQSYRMQKLKRTVDSGMKGILRNLVKPDVLSFDNVNETDINDSTTHQSLDRIYFGAVAKSFLYENSNTVDLEEPSHNDFRSLSFKLNAFAIFSCNLLKNLENLKGYTQPMCWKSSLFQQFHLQCDSK